jgi:hypothetical protein
MAVGAARDRVMRTEVRSALRLVAIGIAASIPVAIAGGCLSAAQLYGVSAIDPSRSRPPLRC